MYGRIVIWMLYLSFERVSGLLLYSPTNGAIKTTVALNVPEIQFADGSSQTTAAQPADEVYSKIETDDRFAQQRDVWPVRLGSSQSLMGGIIDQGWWMATGRQEWNSLYSVNNGKEWVDRGEDEKELLEVMGRSGVKYVFASFMVWNVTWNVLDSSPQYIGPFCKIPLSPKYVLTTAMMCKVVEPGLVFYGGWAYNWVQGEWSLCHREFMGSYTGYTHNHPYAKGQGEVHIALPAVVLGRVSTDPKDWWYFPAAPFTSADTGFVAP